MTSPVVFFDDKYQWCITKSGSLYKLGTNVDIWDMQTLITERNMENIEK